MTPREQAYEKAIQDLIEGVGRLEERQVEDVLAMLERSRVEIAARVASTEWQAAYIPRLREAVERAVEGFRQRYLADHQAALLNQWNAGIDLMDAPLAAAGVAMAAPELSRSALEILQGYSADLIQGLTTDAVKRISNEVTLGVMGGKSPFEVMQAIGRNLDDPSVFGTIATRAEAIARTEMARVHSAARAGRMKAAREAMERLGLKPMKKWVSSHKANPRPNHAALDGKTVPVGEKFPNSEGPAIDYPHAPGLPARETVNCGCSHVVIAEGWEDLPRDYEPVQYEERAIYD